MTSSPAAGSSSASSASQALFKPVQNTDSSSLPSSVTPTRFVDTPYGRKKVMELTHAELLVHMAKYDADGTPPEDDLSLMPPFDPNASVEEPEARDEKGHMLSEIVAELVIQVREERLLKGLSLIPIEHSCSSFSSSSV